MSWTDVRLGRLYRRIEEAGRPDLPLLSVYRELGVVPREGREDNYNKPSDDLSTYKVVWPGDLVLNKMKTWQGSLGVSAYEGIVSPAYFVGRRVAEVHDRFMHHLLRSKALIAQYGARSKGIRPSQWDLSWDEFAAISVALPPLPDQRSIAYYLDAETARIDALIEKKTQLIGRIDEQLSAFADHVVWAGVSNTIPLMYRTDPTRPIMYGIVLPGPDVPVGVPIVKGGDVAAGTLSPSELCRTTPEIEAPYARARLRANDLVFAIRGGIGDVRVVPPEIEGANITQDVARVAPGADVDPRWVETVLRTGPVRAQVDERTTGATIRGLNIWELKRVRIPWSDAQRQHRDMRMLVPALERRQALAERLGRQILLLREHRQALITAAVTGELEVPRAAP